MESFLEKIAYLPEKDVMIFSDDSIDDLIVTVCYNSKGDITACRCFIIEEESNEVMAV